MAKKQRRTKATRQRSRATRPLPERVDRQAATVSPGRQQSARVLPGSEDRAARYEHVLPELKRIGIIAGVMVIVLVILALALG
ncbi:MAG: hypothetical protein ACNA7X_02220 [Dehalococcoidia bacterium]